MIGAGHNIRVQMWNGDELIQDGWVAPGMSTGHVRFVDGPVTITHFQIVRYTNEERALVEGVDGRPLGE